MTLHITGHADLVATIEAQRREIAELHAWKADMESVLDMLPSSALYTASLADARRWRHARKFLAIEDVEMWSGESWGWHVPLELESTKTDAAIDAAIAGDKP